MLIPSCSHARFSFLLPPIADDGPAFSYLLLQLLLLPPPPSSIALARISSSLLSERPPDRPFAAAAAAETAFGRRCRPSLARGSGGGNDDAQDNGSGTEGASLSSSAGQRWQQHNPTEYLIFSAHSAFGRTAAASRHTDKHTGRGRTQRTGTTTDLGLLASELSSPFRAPASIGRLSFSPPPPRSS
jgi:hypothetical protein